MVRKPCGPAEKVLRSGRRRAGASRGGAWDAAPRGLPLGLPRQRSTLATGTASRAFAWACSPDPSRPGPEARMKPAAASPEGVVGAAGTPRNRGARQRLEIDL